jgi:hypothetical protein
MAEELGKIEKPEVGSFTKPRKLFFVPLIFAPAEPEGDLGERIRGYWAEVDAHVDWTRCLAIGLQNQRVLATVYESYSDAHSSRNKGIVQRMDETLKEGDVGILLMREGHQLQFPSDIEVFYVAPPALDDLKRWLRDREREVEAEGQADESREKEEG